MAPLSTDPTPAPHGLVTTIVRGLGSARTWAVSAAVFVAFAWVFFASAAPFSIPSVQDECGQAPLDVRMHSTVDDVDGFLEACGPTGRARYRNMQVADSFYPLVFGIFLSSSLVIVLGRLGPGRGTVTILAAVPIAATLFDYLENSFAWVALASFPGGAPTNGLLGYMSTAKSITSWVAGSMVLMALGVLAVRRLMHRELRLSQQGP